MVANRETCESCDLDELKLTSILKSLKNLFKALAQSRYAYSWITKSDKPSSLEPPNSLTNLTHMKRST